MKNKYVTFGIEGEFVTNLAREWFYLEKRPYEKVEALLLSCMCGTDISLDTLKGYVEDILTFKKKFEGRTRDNTFGLVEESPNIKLPNYIRTKNIEAYYNRLKSPSEGEFYEYGYINPNGEFIAVKWAQHSEWAEKYLKSKYTIAERIKLRKRGDIFGSDFLVYTEGWVLLHSPRQGVAKAEYDGRLTKAQRETLYDYYIFFNRIKEANELYEE